MFKFEEFKIVKSWLLKGEWGHLKPRKYVMDYITFENYYCYYKVNKEYLTILEDLSFSIKKGELLVVVGATGVGKTTLLKSIVGLIKDISGDILINGKSIDKLDLRFENIAYVPQEVALYPNLTIYDNLAYPLKNMRTSYEEIDYRVKEIAKKFNISLFLTRKPKQLSGGQQQTVSLAKALIKNPHLLLLDEPFSNIDVQRKIDIVKNFRKMHDEGNFTTILVTHDIREALMIADRILILENGKIEQLDTPENIIKSNKSSLIKGYIDETSKPLWDEDWWF